MSKPTSDVVVIYHADCLDGFCAAWMAWRKFGDEAEYVPAYYGKPPPDVTNREVYVVDFSYPFEVTMHMAGLARSLVVLDHHATAKRELALVDTLPEAQRRNLSVTFDMDRSGAGIARDFFHPGMDCWIVDYTQDRDLWRFALPDSTEVNAYLGTMPQTFADYETLHESVSIDGAAVLGVGAAAYKRMYVTKMVPHARRVRFAGYDNIPVVNAPFVGISELVGELAQTALFAVGWFQRDDGKVVYSLRSRGGFDVAALAEKFGGGGHKAAAGFQLDWPVPEVRLP